MNLRLIGKSAPDAEEQRLLERFRSEIYEDAFSGDEKEDFSVILKRVGTSQKKDDKGVDIQTYIVLSQEKGRVLGGLVADWYPACNSLEIIYLVVHPDYRGKGYGSKLLDKGMPLIQECTGQIACTYFESENPFYPGNQPNPDRMAFFAKNGAMRIPIDYVQPPLSLEQGFAYNLRLFCFPQYAQNVKRHRDGSRRLPDDSLIQFLRCFYDGLKKNARDETKLKDELEKMECQIGVVMDEKEMVHLDSIQETSQFHIERMSIATHFSYTPARSDGKLPFDTHECPTFFSYETDLMDYSRQGESRPFKTRFQMLMEDVELRAPLFYEFTSEGQSCFRIPERKVIKVDISLNWSYRKASPLVPMLHVVVCPSRSGSFFTEQEAIRFITAFGSRQEQYRCMDVQGEIRYEPWGGFFVIDKDSQDVPLLEWIRCKLNLPGILKATHAGISELDLSGLNAVLKNGKYGLLYKNSKKQSAFESFKSEITKKTPWNKVLCGIILGIFDYDRMNTAEIYDTIRPMVERPQSFMVLLRGHLIKIKGVEPGEDYERVENILISPYLLVPSTALAYNGLLLDYCDEEVASVEKDLTAASQKSFIRKANEDMDYFSKSQMIQRKCSVISDTLSANFLQEVFQYESEREILTAGNRQRGLTDRALALQEKIGSTKKEADHLYKEFQRGVDMNQSMLLLVLAILQVVTGLLTSGKNWWVLLAISIVLSILFLLKGRRFLDKTRKG